uniref:Uncharacterized protein n=1 Tax=Sparus aurata TaxID=8175 RepID=A0A671XDG6_SPAAU
MKMMSGRVTSCCVALLLVLTSVSAVQRLNSIEDLKKINFGQSVPKHSLMLLHWFANTVDINHNNVMQLTFNPERGDYGSHYYSNYEELLGQLPPGHQYYTVGNLYQDTSVQLPDYVVDPPMEYEGENRDRIIIRVRGQRMDQVYITQHYDTSEYQGAPYDPDHTYQITVNLLRQIKYFSVRDGQWSPLRLRNHFRSNADINKIRRTWGNLACLGLFLFIVQERYFYNQQNRSENRQNLWGGGGASRIRDSGSQYNSEPSVDRGLRCCLCCFFIILIVCFISFLTMFHKRLR